MCKKNMWLQYKDTLGNFDFHFIRLLKIQMKLKTLFEIRPSLLTASGY